MADQGDRTQHDEVQHDEVQHDEVQHDEVQHDEVQHDEIDGVVAALRARLDSLPPEMRHRRVFIETYLRTTIAVGQAVAAGRFEDPGWVRPWDAVFAGFFLQAHDADLVGGEVSQPWRLAFGAADDLPALLPLLLALNAHINFDLPQAMMAMISDQDFDDPELVQRRRRDHERIDDVLASRVAAEGDALGRVRPVRDWLLTPLNRWSSRRFLRQARHDVWFNVAELHRARRQGPRAYELRVAELSELSSAKIADLLRPGPVLLRLGLKGFGIRLSPASS